LRFSDAVVTVSPSLQWELTKRFPQYSTKVRVICNGIDQAFFDAGKQAARLHKGILSEAREHDSVLVRFVYVGNLVAGKGVDVILQAAASLPEDNWSLAIIGDGPEREALEEYCQEQGMEGKVTFHGSAPPDEVPLLMRGADVFVFASFAEGRPNVVLEAMATGLPVIAGAIPAVLDLIESKKQGLLFPPGDVHALAEHMLLLINDPAARQRLGSGAKEYLVSAGLSWPESAREYARLYTEVIEKS
ncbi:MAG: glycosyltransferase family 1 protein, partial [Candidatus Electrothrix sp. ATG2]|nr:glycosyltransferase family 1 protein [Candidatus Electrothrix sp. ATG2]